MEKRASVRHRMLPATIVFLLSLCCSSMSLAGTAGTVVSLDSNFGSRMLSAEVEVLEDPTGLLSFGAVQSADAAFQRATGASDAALSFGYSPSVFWFRFSVTSPKAQDLLLELGFASLDQVDFFGPHGERLGAGDHLPFSVRLIPHRHFVFPLKVGAGETATAYLRVASEGTLTIPLRLWQPQVFERASRSSYGLLFAYYGMLLALALYNLLLFLSLRDRIYLAYVAFALSMALAQISDNGLGNEYLWQRWPEWGNLAYPIGFATMGFFGAIFTRGFLQTQRIAPRLDAVILALTGLFAFCVVAPAFMAYRYVAIQIALTGIGFSLLAVFAGAYVWRAGHLSARWFLLAWAALLTGVILTSMRHMGWLPTSFLTLYGIQLGSALEILLLSLALADRMHILQREKQDFQAEVLATRQELVANLRRSEAELEFRVNERTAELEHANARLRDNERQLQAMAHADSLTGLANRLLLEARLEQALQKSRREGSKVALLLIDLDHFKPINDQYGHAIGDDVLRTVAERLLATVRETDTVARLGGDEFVVVLNEVAGETEAGQVATKINATLAEPLRVLGMPLDITASVGVAMYSDGPVSQGDLLRQADIAMYSVKNAGRGGWALYRQESAGNP
jgi:diguanylate cyclase (GGDEF)-like protein